METMSQATPTPTAAGLSATISYTLNDETQRAQIAATGHPVPRAQVHDIPVTADDLEYLDVQADGRLSKVIGALNGYTVQTVAASADPVAAFEAYKQAVRDDRERRRGINAAAEAETLARLQATEAADAAAAAYIDKATPSASITESYLKGTALHAVGVQQPNYQAAIPLIQAALRRYAERVTEAARLKTEAERADQAAKAAYITAWLNAHAPADTIAQHAAGLLCRATAVSMIADAVLDPIGPEWPKTAMCEINSCPCYQYKEEPCIPRRLYPAWKALEAKLPQGTTQEFFSARECLRDEDGSYGSDDDRETAGPKQWGVFLTVPHGPFVFERRIKL
jgi:hypothetical protein